MKNLIRDVLGLLLLSHSVISNASDPLRYAYHKSPTFREVTENGEPTGLDIDVLSAVSAKMNTAVIPLLCPLERCLRLLQVGELDLISGVVRTRQREAYLHYVFPPYYVSRKRFTFYGRAEDLPEVKTLTDLNGLSVAIVAGERYFPAFQNAGKVFKVRTADIQAQIDMVKSERADLMIAAAFISDKPTKSIPQLASLKKLAFSQQRIVSVHFALSKQRQDLAAKLSAAIRQVQQSGEMDAILKKYNIAN